MFKIFNFFVFWKSVAFYALKVRIPGMHMECKDLKLRKRYIYMYIAQLLYLYCAYWKFITFQLGPFSRKRSNILLDV